MSEVKNAENVMAWQLTDLQNIGHSISETARRMPHAIAVAAPARKQPKQLAPGKSYRYDTITFGELDRASDKIALGLSRIGVSPGTRIALMVPPGIEFVKHVFGLFKSGAVAILIDPGMGRKNLVQCLSDAKPEGMVGIAKAHLARNIYRFKFPLCKKNVVVGGRFLGCKRASKFEDLNEKDFNPVTIDRENEAAIIFTTGSTGPPKGVLYRHRIFIRQVEQIRDFYNIRPGGTDVSGFPLFALFNSAMGTTTVFPEMEPTRPAEIYPPNLIDAVEQFSANQSFGSPALWNTVSKYCEQNGVRLESVKLVLTAGAPVSPDVLERTRKIIAPDGDIHTPYGATESLPVASNSASVVLSETAERTKSGAGTCVGNRFSGINWRLIEITDDPIASIGDTREVEHGQVGELIVQGPVVTDQYVTRTSANADHKIKDGDCFWHRMGDVGYFDDQGRFWFCGRKGHRVQTTNGVMFTIPCEGIINTHPKVFRSALVGLNRPSNKTGQADETGQTYETPVLIIEPIKEHWPTDSHQKEALLDEVHVIASQHWQTDSIQHFLIHQSLPVDIRHNSKIFREQLREWAEDRLNANRLVK